MIFNFVKKITPLKLKWCIKFFVLNPIRSNLFKRNFLAQISLARNKSEKIIFIMATPEHSNLGDHAIVQAEYNILKAIGVKQEQIIEISTIDFILCKLFISNCISDKDLIIIDGGGNLGSLWPWEDDKISDIINLFYKNTIIIFPQTCFYDSSNLSNLRLEKNKKIYSTAKDLTICLRDTASYHFCVEQFVGVNLMLIPDVVFSISDLSFPSSKNRNGVLLCFREDLEKEVKISDIEKLKKELSEKKISYNITSTLTNYSVDKLHRCYELNKKWMEFSSAKLIITDRLHGLIFSIITGTPCLAIDNVSKKVSGALALLNNISYVKICSSLNDVILNIDNYYNLNNIDYSKFIKKNIHKELKDYMLKVLNM